ncbi:hypothetical protein V1477_010158 [Vespula maculifrons]|uniref:Uncharacterized protein n=1 Tax=Vespula maculifrons TaxID=7453 RepID=A0ABD2C7R2_VESMC
MQEFYEQIEKLRAFEDHYINKVIGDLNAEISQRQVDKIYMYMKVHHALVQKEDEDSTSKSQLLRDYRKFADTNSAERKYSGFGEVCDIREICNYRKTSQGTGEGEEAQ